MDADACPGVLPESCGWKLSGTVCGICDDGYYIGNAKCHECNDLELSEHHNSIMLCISAIRVIIKSSSTAGFVRALDEP